MLARNWRRWLRDPWLRRMAHDLTALAGRYITEPGGAARLLDDVPRAIRGLEGTARVYVGDPGKLAQLVAAATEKAREMSTDRGPLEEIYYYLMTFLRLLGAYVRGEYRDVSAPALVLMVAAVLYFVSPFDLLPDVVVGLGLIDDAAVIAFVSRPVKGELDKFLSWERGQLGSSAPLRLAGRSSFPDASTEPEGPAQEPDRGGADPIDFSI